MCYVPDKGDINLAEACKCVWSVVHVITSHVVRYFTSEPNGGCCAKKIKISLAKVIILVVVNQFIL